MLGRSCRPAHPVHGPLQIGLRDFEAMGPEDNQCFGWEVLQAQDLGHEVILPVEER